MAVCVAYAPIADVSAEQQVTGLTKRIASKYSRVARNRDITKKHSRLNEYLNAVHFIKLVQILSERVFQDFKSTSVADRVVRASIQSIVTSILLIYVGGGANGFLRIPVSLPFILERYEERSNVVAELRAYSPDKPVVDRENPCRGKQLIVR